ncbi:unnamed protein product, partial [Rotaria sp. Silwood2]
SSTTNKTFRFNSGQLLTLNEYQIGKIPYLTALVSTGPHFDSIKVDEGHYLLDSRIDYQDFLFALDSISFHSVRQIFIHLPKNYNTLAIIALLDFLGVGFKRGPILEEVNSTFFWNFEYGDELGSYQLIYRSSDARDMAVRFAIAMANEEYDFSNRQIIDQIYWFIMFILSAYELFETNLRYHVYKIAENYFSVFCPSLLKCLYQLEQRTEKEIQEKSISTSNYIDPKQENNLLWNFNMFNNDHTCHIWDRNFLGTEHFSQSVISFLRWNSYSYGFNRYCKMFYYGDEDLEPIYKKVLKYMYKCLLSTVLEQVSAETSGNKFDDFDQVKYKTILHDILNRNTVQVAIQERILSEICELTAKLEDKYAKLKKTIQVYERNLNALIQDETQSYSLRQAVWGVGKPTLNRKQNEALMCERILNKLYEYESVLDKIRNKVLNDLHYHFMNEIEGFLDRQQVIWMRLNNISSIQKEKKTLLKLKKMNKIQTTTKYRPLPKIQCKYTTR